MSPGRQRTQAPIVAVLSGAASLALFFVLALFLSGCSGGPKPAAGPGDTARPEVASGSKGTKGSKVWRPAAPDTLGPVVAVIGGRKITRHDVDSVVATVPAGIQAQFREVEGYRGLVERMITQEAVYEAARRANTERDSTYQAELKRYSRDLLMRAYFDAQVRALPEIADSTAQSYYASHEEEFTIRPRARVRHIALASRAKALEIRRALVKGALWDETAAKVSTDKATKANGGLLGWVSKDSDVVPGVGKAPAVVAAAYSLPLEEISQPLKSDKSWHLIKVETREDKTVQPFDTVRERILSRHRNERRDAFGKTLTDSLLKFSNAVIFDDSIRVALTPAKTAEDFFKEAQAAATPLQRIELYRMLITRYPEERVSIQARFMIGFTYAEEMGEYDLARKEFEEFLKLHPDADLAGSAKWMLENMEKPAPDLEEKDSGDGGDEPKAPDSGGSGTSEGSK